MLQKSPTVSVIIPTYNRAQLVGHAVRSVLAQTYQDFELIVIDDASTDNTQELVASFKEPRIRYIRHSQNGGVSAARNTGIEASRGEYIAFLDSDDKWLPEKLEKQVQLFRESDSKVGVIYTWQCFINDNNERTRTLDPKYSGFILDDLLYANVLGTTSTFMVRRECLHKVKGFDSDMPVYGEDWDLWIRLAQQYKFDFVPEVLVHYRDCNEVDRLTKNSKEVVDGCLAILKRYHKDVRVDRTYKNLGFFAKRKKAEIFFDLGRRLICHSSLISHLEAIKVGRHYLLAAFLAYSLNPRFLLHYGASLLGGSAYLKFVTAEGRMRTFAARLIGKRSDSAVVS